MGFPATNTLRNKFQRKYPAEPTLMLIECSPRDRLSDMEFRVQTVACGVGKCPLSSIELLPRME